MTLKSKGDTSSLSPTDIMGVVIMNKTYQVNKQVMTASALISQDV